ncbi:MAG: hypothetical protein UX71_C0004G0005 [Parcubacteria group bacterium GW2011_GWA1_47_10]|nr:MAG: hypothetical protein UX71_C0004G0005 [Parcubacteria group bacterium GW2011_GWA1_47_10]
MSKYIAIVIALVVVGSAFFINISAPKPDGNVGGMGLMLPSLSFSLSNIRMPSLVAKPLPPEGVQAWKTFEQYRTFAQEGNLDGVKSLSHQVSETCANPATFAECQVLMNNVVVFTENFREEDFKNVFFDERQIVMFTDPTETAEGDSLAQVILFFTRRESGEPKVLGMRFCFKMKSDEEKNCFSGGPATRDLDGNGWWDSVESLFYK